MVRISRPLRATHSIPIRLLIFVARRRIGPTDLSDPKSGARPTLNTACASQAKRRLKVRRVHPLVGLFLRTSVASAHFRCYALNLSKWP
jgi:hypothetical protein